MHPTPETEGRRWLDQAREDLKSAEVLLAADRFYLVCFLGQQIAEKALKALLYARGELDVAGHSVARLLRRALRYDPGLAALLAEVPILDTYYIPTRYPNGLPEGIPADAYTRPAAEEALRLARATVEAVDRAAFSPPG